ncbi:hypothetical protein V1504DRAFT_470487 [Lipomyces starkeyi]
MRLRTRIIPSPRRSTPALSISTVSRPEPERSPTPVAPDASPTANAVGQNTLQSAVSQGLVRLDGEGRVIVTEGTLMCPLCSMFGIPEHVYGKVRSVRRHIREQHRVPVAPGNARLGRPRAHVAADDPAHQRSLRRLVSWYLTHGVTADLVRDLADFLCVTVVASVYSVTI